MGEQMAQTIFKRKECSKKLSGTNVSHVAGLYGLPRD